MCVGAVTVLSDSLITDCDYHRDAAAIGLYNNCTHHKFDRVDGIRDCRIAAKEGRRERSLSHCTANVYFTSLVVHERR